MRRVKIYIDPEIKSLYGPEICWTWRVLLGGIGYSWEEVLSKDSKCEIAYVVDFQNSPKSKLCVKADPDRWIQRSNWQLETLGFSNGLVYPIFKGEPRASLDLSLKDGCLICRRDIIFDVFWLVTGQEEKYWPKDKHGFFDLNRTPFLREQVLRLAPASAIGCWLENRLSELFSYLPAPRWPQGKKAAVCLSHDVDNPEINRLLEPIHLIWRRRLSGLRAAVSVLTGTKDYWNFPSWVQLEKDYGVKSAFYFCARKGSLLNYITGTPDPLYDIRSDPYKTLFRYLKDEGFEIGLHASYWALRDQKTLSGEKTVLEEGSAEEIVGNRHHYWHVNPDDVEDTLLLHEKVGLKYDTSLTHERYVGWRRGLCWPFFPFHQTERRELKTLQISTTWMDNQLFGYSGFNPGERHEILRSLIDKAAEQEGFLLADVHDYVFDDTLFPGWLKTYRWLIEESTSRSDLWISTPRQIADHWIRRYSSIIDTSSGLAEGLK